MRAATIHLLTALLIAIFAIGAPLSVRADCLACQDCTVTAPAADHAPCPEATLVCQLSQTCASQAQTMLPRSTAGAMWMLAGTTYDQAPAAAVELTYILPETAPPRI
ncbi:hypothetical protein [Dongia deserti]|uniref:hypothetical protein n=1 Tax=Dongia deserti TaxID=2268030 RepID=UPI000E64FCA4|nr:hypothetical protein [Dongia deserti]